MYRACAFMVRRTDCGQEIFEQLVSSSCPTIDAAAKVLDAMMAYGLVNGGVQRKRKNGSWGFVQEIWKEES